MCVQDGITALMGASRKGHAVAVDFLLNEGANVNKQSTVRAAYSVSWLILTGGFEIIHRVGTRRCMRRA
jgi:ankyrin repeat protein